MTSASFNTIFYWLIGISFIAALVSGALLILKSFFTFRAHVNRSLNMDLDIVRVIRISKPQDKEERKSNEAWKEEIGPMEQLLVSLSNVREKAGIWHRFIYDKPSIVFEIANAAGDEEIVFYVAFPKKFRETVEKQIHSFYPNAVIEKAKDYNIFTPGSFTSAAVLSLKRQYILPIKTYEDLEVDPLNAITNALSKFQTEDEGGAIQMVMQPVKAGWRRKGRKIAHDMQQGKQLKDVYRPNVMSRISKDSGKLIADTLLSTKHKEDIGMADKNVQLTPEEQELVKGIERKANKNGYRVNIRLVASAKTEERSQEILGQLENAFAQYENSDINWFLVKKRSKHKEIAFDFIFRNFKDEEAMILSVEEIASIFHLPISVTETPRIKLLKSSTATPPTNIPAEGVLLGFNEFRGVKTNIRITEDDRRRHLYTIGQTGTGKSTFLQEIAKQDAREGRGFCFIDPHGQAVEDILASIPKERAEDVIIFDPSDIERPFGLNMLECDPSDPSQKSFVINEMMGIFDQLYDLKATGGPMFEYYMRNAMLLVMEDPESGSTLMEIPKVLADENFRHYKLSRCKNPTVVDFWLKEAEKAGGEASLANMVPYIVSKLTSFISNDIMRPIIAQQKSTIDFREIMDDKKILLVNLAKGKIGEINARLLGMVIVGKILMAALSRVNMPEDQRTDFYLYLDEFQNVTTDSITQILSEARKYRLCLILAHQFIGQLKEEISKAVFGNVGSMVSFRVGPEDAEFLEKQFAPVFSASDLINVDNRLCFSRILINNQLTKPFNMATFPPTKGDQEIANAFKELSRLKYGRNKDIVNQEIIERTNMKTLS